MKSSRGIWIVGIIGVGLLGAYAATFSFWWLSSPSMVVIEDGKLVRYRQFEFNPVFWRTRPLWNPAFWFMENVCGYEAAGMMAAEADSILYYRK